MGWEYRVFFPLPATTTTTTTSGPTEASPYCYYTNILRRDKGRAEERRTDDYVIIPSDHSLGLKMRGVSGRTTKQLELKYRSLINALRHESWSKEATSFDVANTVAMTSPAFADALHTAIKLMAKKEKDGRGRWSMASTSLTSPTGRSSSGGLIIASVNKSRWGDGWKGGCAFEQTDLEITSPLWNGVQRWRSMAFEKTITMDAVTPILTALKAQYGDQMLTCGYPEFLTILHSRMTGTPTAGVEVKSTTETKSAPTTTASPPVSTTTTTTTTTTSSTTITSTINVGVVAPQSAPKGDARGSSAVAVDEGA